MQVSLLLLILSVQHQLFSNYVSGSALAWTDETAFAQVRLAGPPFLRQAQKVLKVRNFFIVSLICKSMDLDRIHLLYVRFVNILVIIRILLCNFYIHRLSYRVSD